MDTKFNRSFTRYSLMQITRLLSVLFIIVFILGSTTPSMPGSASDGVWRDEFDGPDLNTWWWVGSDSPQYSLVDEGGEQFLRMVVAGDDPDHPRNLLMRSIPNEDFTITTHMHFAPEVNFQFAGLIIYQDQDSHLALGRAYCDVAEVCVGNGIYFDSVMDGEWGGTNFATPVPEPTEGYLRLVRTGSNVEAWYSPDGSAWTSIGIHMLPEDFSINGIGLITAQDFYTPDAQITADFDYLSITVGAGAEWLDNFNGPTLDGWLWVGDAPGELGIVQSGEEQYLRMPVGGSTPPVGHNFLLTPVIAHDFAITTRVMFDPAADYQFAGLTIFQDTQNFVQLGPAHCFEEWCAGKGIYFDYVPNWDLPNFATVVDNLADIFIRLERRGEMVRAFYSTDGHTDWIEIGTHTISPDFQANYVGLVAGQDFFTPEWNTTADFDFFELNEGSGFLPDGYHDYDQGVVPSWACNAGGWVVDPDDPLADVQVEIVVDDQTINTLPAGEFRQDLLDASVCEDGNCSFHQPLWGSISSYEPHNVAAWAQDTTSGDWVLLRNSNKPLTCRTHDIYTFDPELGLTRQITDMRDKLEFNPEWSPDSKKVIYEVFELDGTPVGVFITDIKTGATAPLAGSEGGNDSAWAPNGKWIAFDRDPAGDPNVYLLPPAGGVPQLLIEDAISASWDPKSKFIAFIRPSDGSLWTVNVESGEQNYLAANAMSPDWSPDGEWIAYRGGDSIFKIHVNNQGLPTGDPIKVTYLIPDAGMPSWSHNSKTIVFHSGQTQDYDLWTVPANGGDPTWLTGAPNWGDYDPSYSFNGKLIAYSSFSIDGQAARQWVSAFAADLEPGFWSASPEPHTYRYEWETNLPEPGTIIQDYERSLMVSTEAPLYDGQVLLRGEQLRGIHTRDGIYCEGVAAIHPNQPTRLLNGYLTDTAMTYAEAVNHFANVSGRAILDESLTVNLSPHEIQSWSSLDWWGYVCTFTDAPLKMDLRVNYGHDWVESFYEAGHWVDITVTESDGVTVKATASVFTEPKDWWNWEPGFQTTPEDWSPSPPDLQPGDWVYARVDNGATAQVQLGEIHGVIHYLDKTVTGTILAPWIEEPVMFECLDWGPAGGQFYIENPFVTPDGSDPYTCSWDPEQWDIQPWQDVGVGYFTPDGHWVANAFTATTWMAFWTYDPPSGFLSEGEHSYYFDWAYSLPIPPYSGTTAAVTIDVTNTGLEPYPGKALFWSYYPVAWTGDACNPVSSVPINQDFRFLVGWVNDFSMTYDEALTHFGSFTMQVFWDDSLVESASFTRTDIQPYYGFDSRMEFLCSLTQP